MPYIQNKKFKIMLELIKARQVEEKSLLTKAIDNLKNKLSEEELKALHQAKKAYTNYILRVLSYSTKIYVNQEKKASPQMSISLNDEDFILHPIDNEVQK